ncbi:MAG: DDE-type integrase/transposase/recombinase [Pseudomonadota bacterium]
MYLAAVKDLATMEIVGPLSAIASDRLPGNGSMSERLKSTLCEDALKMAIRNRRPPRGLIHHSDRGVQYACGDYRKLLDLHGITASMSRKGNCLDNAPMVRAVRAPLRDDFGSLKTELGHRTRFQTRAEARRALLLAPRSPLRNDIEIPCTPQRRHSSIGYRAPAQARIDLAMARAA